MRRIGARLGAGATSLYWYVASKEDLYELMFDALIGEIPLPTPSGDWRNDLEAIAHSSYDVLRQHAWVVLLGIQPGLGPNTQAWGRAALAAFAGRGPDLGTQINSLAALNNYIFGFIHRQLAWEQLRQRSGLDDARWAARLRAYAEESRAHRPDLGRHVAARLELHTDRSFEFGLECLLDGIGARLLAASSAGTATAHPTLRRGRARPRRAKSVSQ